MTKRFFFSLLLAISCMGMAVMAATPLKKTKLHVLYVGGSSDWEKDQSAEDVYQNGVKERMSSFGELLNTYFTEVRIIHASEYRQEMSKGYDVTIMDGTPQPIAPGIENQAKRIYKKPAYLTEDFDLPMLTIADASSTIGSRIGCKNDWFCLCLDAEAHSWRKEHAIFQKPYPVKLETEIKPVPEEASHYQLSLFEGPLPQKLEMWRVQTKGYGTTPGFRVGLVSRPDGYEDCSDGEFISGGVSQKSLDAVAIGRHGNFLHWGFSASPKYMTEQGKIVFVNAVVYISRFKGQGIIVRKYNETIPHRSDLDDYKSLASEKGYKMIVAQTESANQSIRETAEKAKEKQAKGEKLTEREQAFLNMPPLQVRSREEYMQMYLSAYYPMFGTDEQAYVKYFDENRGWFYPDESGSQLRLDEDVKSLDIPNNDLRLLDTAIKMLEGNKEPEKAKRILARYTLMDFPKAAEWRYWFEKNKAKMFFSESGGWVFLIDSREPGVNPYSAWEARKKVSAIPEGNTTDKNPVAVTASREILDSGEQIVYVKIKIHPGYHIYAYTTPDSPFIPTQVELQLPEGYSTAGNLNVPAGRFYSQGGTTIYDGTIVYSQAIQGNGKGPILCKVSYQCCDINICFPPAEANIAVE